MNLGPKKREQLIERALNVLSHEWNSANTPEDERAMRVVVDLVLSDYEARVAPLVEALEDARRQLERMGMEGTRAMMHDALAAYRASLAGESEPSLSELAEQAAHMLFKVNQTGDEGIALAQRIKEALAREREKRS